MELGNGSERILHTANRVLVIYAAFCAVSLVGLFRSCNTQRRRIHTFVASIWQQRLKQYFVSVELFVTLYKNRSAWLDLCARWARRPARTAVHPFYGSWLSDVMDFLIMFSHRIIEWYTSCATLLAHMWRMSMRCVRVCGERACKAQFSQTVRCRCSLIYVQLPWRLNDTFARRVYIWCQYAMVLAYVWAWYIMMAHFVPAPARLPATRVSGFMARYSRN